MVGFKHGIQCVIAGSISLTALCAPTDTADVAMTHAQRALHAEIEPSLPCEPMRSVTSRETLDFAARPENVRVVSTDVPRQDGGSDDTASTLRTGTLRRQQVVHFDVPRTLPASAAPPVLSPTMPIASSVSVDTTRALQRELARHGCYAGEVDGDWGPASRYAAATFNEAVNANLPIDQPNKFLLALARRHQDPVCEQASTIITASTMSARRTVEDENALAELSASRLNASDVSPYAPQFIRPPRIVRANGAYREIDLSRVSEPPPPLPGELASQTRMALGVAPSSPPSGSSSVTRHSAKRHAAPRTAARNRQSQPRKQASRQRWKRQVLQSINLSGS